MVNFNAEIERFDKKGEKTGWTFIFIPQTIANAIKPGCRKSYRVRGKIDHVEINGLSFVPMGEGDFILALKTSLRKELKKEKGAIVQLQLEEDFDFKIEMSKEMEMVLAEEPHLLQHFLKLAKSHQNYYINWFNDAKSDLTRVKRLTAIVNAMDRQLDFGEMMREYKTIK